MKGADLEKVADLWSQEVACPGFGVCSQLWGSQIASPCQCVPSSLWPKSKGTATGLLGGLLAVRRSVRGATYTVKAHLKEIRRNKDFFFF